MKEKLLFAAHGGHCCGRHAAIIMQDHCLPIACSRRSFDEHGPAVEFGLHACWEATGNAEEFFEYLGIRAVYEPSNTDKLPDGWRPEGLYVYEASYDDDIEPSEDDDWSHLQEGELRRPTIEELEPLTRGLAPWNGVML